MSVSAKDFYRRAIRILMLSPCYFMMTQSQRVKEIERTADRILKAQERGIMI
jgi:hypothetical protein